MMEHIWNKIGTNTCNCSECEVALYCITCGCVKSEIYGIAYFYDSDGLFYESKPCEFLSCAEVIAKHIL
jgi:hypothetical protein